jgi:hypothetical protein
MADASGEFLVRALEKESRRPEAVAVRVQARYDDVEAALATVA